VAVAFAAQVGLLVFVVVHNYVSPDAAVGSDLAPLWLGGSVWRTLGPSHGYDAAAQSALYAHLTGGHGWTYPTTWAPGSMLLGIPLSLLSLAPAGFELTPTAWLEAMVRRLQSAR
jgi:hypothetical protein